MPSAAATNSPLIYQFHALLLQVSPAVWRRVLLTNDTYFAQLHRLSQIMLGWSDLLPYRFLLHAQQYGVFSLVRAAI